MRTRTVFIEALEIMASIGVYEREHRDRQRLIVSLSLQVLDRYDGRSERIGDVYDYDAAIGVIREAATARHHKLLETLAETIASGVLEDGDVMAVVVRLAKPEVLGAGARVGIEIVRTRQVSAGVRS